MSDVNKSVDDLKMELAMEGYRTALNSSNDVLVRMNEDVYNLEMLLNKLTMNRPVKGVNWRRLDDAISKVIDEAKKDADEFKETIDSIKNS